MRINMKHKYKIISIIILVLLMIISVFIGINYRNTRDNKEFKEVLKNANNMENTTDKHITVYDTI